MKVALIGKGTSAIITALMLLKNNHQVTIYYDPNTPHINVGESTTPHIQKLIQDVLNISVHDMVDSGVFSYKMGINFVDWGCGKQFNHNFGNGEIANHFETKEFNAFIHKYLENNSIVKYIGRRVDKYSANLNYVEIDGKKYDFIVNCAGWEDDSNYHDPVFSTVNSGVLFTDKLDYSSNHTLHLATEDGWQFGLPFPAQNKFKCGYLYNNTYTSESDVKDKLDKKEVYASFSWKPRYAKELLVNKRIALNGNRLFFLEPLQALSLFYTHQFAEMICEYLNNMSEGNMIVTNHRYLYDMWCYQFSLAYHYQFGSVHDSQFWRDTQSNAKQFMKYNFNGNEDIFKQNLEYDIHLSNSNIENTVFALSKIGTFSYRDHCYILNGMKGN